MSGQTRQQRLWKCRACNKPWTEHLGVQGTCAQLQRAKKALRVVHRWVTKDGGKMPLPIAKAIVKAIKGD